VLLDEKVVFPFSFEQIFACVRVGNILRHENAKS
jgi:hypothetical protein